MMVCWDELICTTIIVHLVDTLSQSESQEAYPCGILDQGPSSSLLKEVKNSPSFGLREPNDTSTVIRW